MQIGMLIVALIMPYAFQAFFGAVFLFIGVLPDLLQGKPFDPHAIEHMPTMLGLALIQSFAVFLLQTYAAVSPSAHRRQAQIIAGADDHGFIEFSLYQLFCSLHLDAF